MDSVKALVEKLSEQLRQNEDKTRLIITAQQILTELGGAVVSKPLPQNIYQEANMVSPAEEVVMQAQVTPELAPIKNTVQELGIPVEVIDENLVAKIVEAKTEPSQVASEKTEIKEVKEVKDHLVLEPIKDLRSAIGINDKFQFIQELFGGDEKSFEVGIKTINAFKIFPEAQFYIKRELREKNNWDEESNVVKQFDQLIKRRFS
jgi:NH3-dependent NAD+ synthetase